MSVNMSYCKFENTLAALRECEDSIFTPCENEREERARIQLLDLCQSIGDDYYDDNGDEIEE